MDLEIAVTGTGILLPQADNVHEFASTTAITKQIDSFALNVVGKNFKISKINGQHQHRDSPSLFRWKFLNELYFAINQALTDAGLEEKKKLRQAIGLANNIFYQMPGDENFNPRYLKVMMEYQTLGKYLDFQGPRFTFKEGESSALACIDHISSLLGKSNPMMILSGISEPNPFLTRLEILYELRSILPHFTVGYPIPINTRFAEAAGAVLLETLEHAHKRNTHVFATIAGSYHCYRRLNYENRDHIKTHIRRCVEKLISSSGDDNVNVVFGFFTHNGIIDEIEREVLTDFFPGAHVVSTSSWLGNCLSIHGLIDLIFAAKLDEPECLPPALTPILGQIRNSEDIGILVHTLSRFGDYAGVVLKKARKNS